MCGIIGGISNLHLDFIQPSLQSIAHRGPDSNGIYYDKNIALGHTRLSIQDLSDNGKQPMISDDGRYVLIFNGEIYNHFEIREDLVDKHFFKSTSDTETLLYLLIEEGVESLNRLNGVFAFAFYDIATQDLFIARDNFGVKPLYYYKDADTFLFGSELKSFLFHPEFDREVDVKALSRYLTYLYSPTEDTPFKSVKRLEPGHYIKLNVKTPEEYSVVKYYDIPFSSGYSQKAEKDLLLELESKLLVAVERQMLSDVPVGFFLSGGVDSSALVAMARKLYPDRKLQCFTLDLGGENRYEGFSDDLHFAKKAADYFNADLEIVRADINIVADFDKMIYHLDEPLADPASLHVYNISKKAREMGYKVLIGGTAGDDLFSGYRRHQALVYEKYLEWLPPTVRQFFERLIGNFNVKNAEVRRLKKFFAGSELGRVERMKNYYSWLPWNITKNLFSIQAKSELENFIPADIFHRLLKNIPADCPDLNKMLYWELKTYLVNNNLIYSDKMSMAVGVEVRVPFLDKDLVEFSTSIPVNLKMKGTTTKYLLKKVMEKYLPHDVIYRPKAGFGAPVRKWICEDLDETINAYLSPERIRERGIFNDTAVCQLIEDNKSGKIDASYPIWCLLAIESWMRQFKD